MSLLHVLGKIDLAAEDASDGIQLGTIGVGAEFVLGGPMAVQRISVVVVGEFVARHVAEIAHVVNVLEMLQHGFAVQKRLVVAELARRMAGEGLGIFFSAGSVDVVSHFVGRVNVELGEEGNALARARVAESASVVVLAKMPLQQIEAVEGTLRFPAVPFIDVPAFVEGADEIDQGLQFGRAFRAGDVAVQGKKPLGVDVVEFCQKFHFGFFVDVGFRISGCHFRDRESGDLLSANEAVGRIFCWKPMR